MKTFVFFAFLAVFLTGAFFAPSAWADSTAYAATEQTASIPKANPTLSAASAVNKELARKQKTLVKSALEWMAKANTHLLPSRRKPRIVKNPDGTYKAVYFMRRQYLDEERNAYAKNLFEVTKEKHGYSGTFRFVEVVYEAHGKTPDECKKGRFVPKVKRPNAQIFSFTNGTWR